MRQTYVFSCENEAKVGEGLVVGEIGVVAVVFAVSAAVVAAVSKVRRRGEKRETRNSPAPLPLLAQPVEAAPARSQRHGRIPSSPRRKSAESIKRSLAVGVARLLGVGEEATAPAVWRRQQQHPIINASLGKRLCRVEKRMAERVGCKPAQSRTRGVALGGEI